MWPSKEATRSDLTVSKDHNSGLEESTLQNIHIMNTSSNMGNSARVDGGYGMPVSLSHADQCAEGTLQILTTLLVLCTCAELGYVSGRASGCTY